jgi:hypothetical protein
VGYREMVGEGLLVYDARDPGVVAVDLRALLDELFDRMVAMVSIEHVQPGLISFRLAGSGKLYALSGWSRDPNRFSVGQSG